MATRVSDAPGKYLESHWNEYVEDLKTLVRIPSVSFPGFDPKVVVQSANAVAELMKKRGLENVEILELPGAHPYVYGDWLKAPGKPTLLLYAHHDVQPPGRESVWKTPPFEPVIQPGPGGERMYARGAADDKAGIIVHTSAIDSYLKTLGKLPLNVKVIIEGEEEIGSSHLLDFLKKYRSKLDADILVLTDTLNFDCGIPGLTVALRGLVGLGVEVRALKNTVHSGMWGGPVPDPAMALSKMLAQLVDAEGRIAVPGVMEQVPQFTARERAQFEAIPFDEKRFREQAGMVDGASLLKNKEGLNPLVQIWRMPSLSVKALQASSRLQAGNVINDAAWAKVTIRLAPGMDAPKTLSSLETHLKKSLPWGLELDLHREVCSGPWSTDPSQPQNLKAFQAADRALERGYGKRPIHMGCGGSIPFVEPFAEALRGAPALLIGVEDPFTNAHGENESVLLSDLKKVSLGQIFLFEELLLDQ